MTKKYFTIANKLSLGVHEANFNTIFKYIKKEYGIFEKDVIEEYHEADQQWKKMVFYAEQAQKLVEVKDKPAQYTEHILRKDYKEFPFNVVWTNEKCQTWKANLKDNFRKHYLPEYSTIYALYSGADLPYAVKQLYKDCWYRNYTVIAVEVIATDNSINFIEHIITDNKDNKYTVSTLDMAAYGVVDSVERSLLEDELQQYSISMPQKVYIDRFSRVYEIDEGYLPRSKKSTCKITKRDYKRLAPIEAANESTVEEYKQLLAEYKKLPIEALLMDDEMICPECGRITSKRGCRDCDPESIPEVVSYREYMVQDDEEENFMENIFGILWDDPEDEPEDTEF